MGMSMTSPELNQYLEVIAKLIESLGENPKNGLDEKTAKKAAEVVREAKVKA